MRSNNGYLSLRTAVSHPFFNLSINTDHHSSPSPRIRNLKQNFYQFYSCLVRSDEILPTTFLFFLPRRNIQKFSLLLVESVIKFFETRFEEKFSTIQFRSKHEADSWDTKGGEKKSLLSLEDIFSTLSGDGVSSYRPRLHLDSRLLVL